jgi:hypothetical protein
MKMYFGYFFFSFQSLQTHNLPSHRRSCTEERSIRAPLIPLPHRTVDVNQKWLIRNPDPGLLKRILPQSNGIFM